MSAGERTVAVVACTLFAMSILYLGGVLVWWQLSNYIQPNTPTERKDLANVFVLIAAGVVGFLTALAAMLNVYMSRKSLHQQRELDELRAHDDALQAYYEHVGDLLTKHKLRDREDENDPIRLLAQAQTLTVLRRVDATRQEDLVRFLCGAQLTTGNKPILHLMRADLSNIDLSSANIWGAKLHGVVLSRANLSNANLSNANLSNARLDGAVLYLAILRGADLSEANLNGANLMGAKLSGANLHRAYLSGANLLGAKELTEKQLAQAIGNPKSWPQDAAEQTGKNEQP